MPDRLARTRGPGGRPAAERLRDFCQFRRHRLAARTGQADDQGYEDRPTALSATAPPVPHRAGSGLGIVEGWQGSTVHRVEVGLSGALARCKIVDPSFRNWPALSVALAGADVPDFPLANKSFNLSYAGNDL